MATGGKAGKRRRAGTAAGRKAGERRERTGKEQGRTGTAAGGAGGRRKRVKRATFTARFGLASLAYRVPEEYLTDLAQEIDQLSKLLHHSESTGVNKVAATISRLETDARYAAIKQALRRVRAYVRAGQWSEARELAVGIFNVAWDRSQEYQVGRDAFIRRIRGKGFKPLSHAHPLTSDRAAALAWIMQQDRTALDEVIDKPSRASELVIELTGDFDVIRLTKD